jgi:alpha-beta hydrolase superfamily lysophospholipase
MPAPYDERVPDVTRDHRTFTDARGVVIHYYVWSAEEPKAVVQLAHGLGEHALRYERTAQRLVEAGYTVVADDHRGHGATGMQQHDGDTTRLGRLGPGGLRATVAAIEQLTGIIRMDRPGLPIVLLGHSWGSLMAQWIVDRDARPYAALVLTGTAYRTLRHMNSGDLSKRHRHLGDTGHEWLSRDPLVAQAFADDPLTFKAEAAKLFGYIDGLRLLGRPRRMTATLPVLIMIGGEDTLGGEASVRMLERAYRERSGLIDVTTTVYPEARHEVFNELNRDEVVDDLVRWLDARL